MARAFLDWLVKLLCGRTKSEYFESLQQQWAVSRSQSQEDEILYLRSQLESERARCEKLQEMIFRKFGILVSDIPQQPRKQVEPIQTSQLPWPERKRRLEQLDRDLAREANKQSPESRRTEEHWRAQGAVPVSLGIDKDFEDSSEETRSAG